MNKSARFVIRVVSYPIFTAGLSLASMTVKITDVPIEQMAYWRQPVHWYGAGLIIVGLCIFVLSFIMKKKGD